MITVIFYLAAIAVGVSIAMVSPVVVAFGFGEAEVGTRLAVYAGLSGFLATATLLALRGYYGSLDRVTGIYLSVISWVLLPVIIAFPLSDILQINALDSYFEAVSSFTTTAASLIPSVSELPKSIIFLRAQFQWLGGYATLLTVILIIAPGHLGGMPSSSGSTASHAVFSRPESLAYFCWRLAQVYLLVTLLCLVALLMCRIPVYQAIVLTMTAVSSGGYLPGDDSLQDVSGTAGMIVIAIFFIVASTSILWHRMIVYWERDALSAHRESYYVLVIWIALALLFTKEILGASGSSLSVAGTAFAEGLVNSASAVSTSGLQSRPGIFALAPPILILFVLVLGGGSNSTSSGIKFYRVGGMLRQSIHEINLLIHPHAMRSRKFGSVNYDIQMMKAIWIVFVLMIFFIVIGTGLLSLTGMNFQAGFTAAVSALTNAGPAYGPEWGPQTEEGWPTYAEMSQAQKLLLLLMMLIGRVEIIMAIAVLNYGYWTSR